VPGWNRNGYQYINIHGQCLVVGQLVAHIHVRPRPAGSNVCVRRRGKGPGDDSATNLAWSTTGPEQKQVYAIAALGAAHFVREYASVQEAADDVGRAVGTIKQAMCYKQKRGGYFWTRTRPAKGQDPLWVLLVR